MMAAPEWDTVLDTALAMTPATGAPQEAHKRNSRWLSTSTAAHSDLDFDTFWVSKDDHISSTHR